jgi:hypothetical protein
MSIDFKYINQLAVPHIREWLPGGHEDGGQWVVKNPTRDDREAGSFRVNLTTGAGNDYAGDGWYGHDAVSLYAYIHGMRNIDAAREILGKYDPSYFPSPNDIAAADTWRQLTRGTKNAPCLAPQGNEQARWPFEIKVGQDWRTVMYVIRYINATGGKDDIPYTLWTDGRAVEWRKKALHGVKYPIYGLRALTERPNARVVLYEGQKKPARVQPVLGDDWVCVGYYGGSGNVGMTDFDPLVGREVWYPFDADIPGRKAIKKLIDDLHVKAHLVYPPADVAKGWDHADAVDEGWTKEDLERALMTDAPAVTPPAVVMALPENRPTRLDTPVSVDFREYIMENIYITDTDKEGKPRTRTRNDWFFFVAENDTAIKNSIKYDYTTGTKATAYDSSELYDSALEQRLQQLGVQANLVTKAVKERLTGRVLNMNCNYNRVADYMDTLIAEHGPGTPEVLDEFMKALTFNFERGPREDPEAFVKRCEREELLYRELFHKFFIRMHGHIRGTRKNAETGDYLGLIENDIVPILEGSQGMGKTTFCRWVACEDELYIDLGSGMKQAFGNAETVKKIRGRLLAEIGEMKIMKNADAVETIKSFISMKAATIDVKYVESQRDIPMTVSFIGTSNPDQYLSDDTGNRRFWPVKMKGIDLAYMADHKDLPKKLHAHYQSMALKMTTDEIYAACRASKELAEMMNKLREDALITYSDYEACVKLVRKWKDNNAGGGTLDQADIERMALDERYPTRISRKSFERAVKDAGFVQTRTWEAGGSRSMKVWAWTPESKTDEAPF